MASCAEHPFLDGDELMALVRERMAAGQTVRYLPFRGVSMMPMLRQGKDQVELSPLPERLKKYDLPLYQLPGGKYVMHRVVEVRDDCYICNGDNLTIMETVSPGQMIALVSAFTRNGKRIETDNSGYLLYAKFWCAIRPVRHVVMRAVRKVRRVLGRIKRSLF